MSLTTKTKVLIGVISGVVAIGGATAGVIAYNNTPKALLLRAVKNTQKDVEASDRYQQMESLFNHGSISVDTDFSYEDYYWDYDNIYSSEPYTREIPIDINASLYFNGMLRYAENFDVSIDTNNINGSIIFTPECATFESNTIYDEALGVDIENLSDTLPGSIYDPDEDTEYSLDDDLYDYLLNLYSRLGALEGLDDEAKTIVESYRNQFITSLIKNSEATKKNDYVEAGDDNIHCTAVEVTTEGLAVIDIAKDIIDYAMDDEELLSVVERYAALMAFDDDPDDLVDDFYDELEDLYDELDDLDEDDYEDTEITSIFYISKWSTKLVAVDVDIEFNNKDMEDISISYILGENITESNYIYYSIESDSRTDEITYEVIEDSKDYYEAKIIIHETRNYDDEYSFYGNYDSTYGFQIEYDKDSGDFEIFGIKDLRDKFSIEGTYEESADLIVITIDELTVEDEAISDLNMVVTIDLDAEFPEIPEYVDVISLDEDELEELMENISEFANSQIH